MLLTKINRSSRQELYQQQLKQQQSTIHKIKKVHPEHWNQLVNSHSQTDKDQRIVERIKQALANDQQENNGTLENNRANGKTSSTSTLLTMSSRKFISGTFLNQYPDFPKHMNPLGQFVALRTYSRYVPGQGRRESWKEICHRAVEYNVYLEFDHLKRNKLPINMASLKKEAEFLFDNMFNLRQFLSGRTLWVGGTEAASKFSLSNFNCSFLKICSWKDLAWDLFYLLMVGTGVRFKCTKDMANHLPKIRTGINIIHSKFEPLSPEERLERTHVMQLPNGYVKIYIGDSKEGWVEALHYFFTIATESEYDHVHTVKISYNSVRPRGERLKSFGGTASGYEPLKEMFEGIQKVLQNKIDPELKPIELDEFGYGHVRPIHVLDIANLIGNNVVVGGVRRCIPKDALVHTRKGLIPIQDVQIGEEALTTQGYKPITDWFDQGPRNLININTQDGNFVCTENHRMPVLTSFKEYKWVEAGKLQKGDRLITARQAIEGVETSLPTWSYNKPKHSTTCTDLTIPPLDPDMAWLVGLFHADGYTYPAYAQNGYGAYVSLVFGSEEGHIAEKAKAQLQRFGPTLHVVMAPRKNENSIIVTCKSKQLAWYMDKNFKQANTSIKVPEWILCGTNQVRLAYVAGVMDGDGCVLDKHIVSTVYESFARDLQKVLYSCGIESRLHIQTTPPPSRVGWQPMHHVKLITKRSQAMVNAVPQLMKDLPETSRSQNANGFPISFTTNLPSSVRCKAGLHCSRKTQFNIDSYERLYEESNNICPVEVLSIEPAGNGHTYDITVEDQHEFFVNGYLSHNTSEISLFDWDDHEVLLAKYGINGLSQTQLDHHLKVGQLLERAGIAKPSWFDRLCEFGEYGYAPPRPGINHRRMSNNSIAFTEKPSPEFMDLVFAIMRGEGEPGFVNLEEANRRRPNAEGLNPCLSADSMILTTQGLQAIRDLIGVAFVAIVNGKEYPSTPQGFWKTGCNKRVYRLTLENGLEIKATDNHQFLVRSLNQDKYGEQEWKELKDLQSGDVLVIPDNSSYSNNNNTDSSSNELFANGYQVGLSAPRSGSCIPECGGSIAFTRGLLKGIFDACALVVSGQIILSSNKIQDLKSIQRLLFSVGVACSIEVHHECFQLCVPQAMLQQFQEAVGFSDEGKQSLLIDEVFFQTNIFGSG